MVNSGIPRRSVTSDIARVRDEANAPKMAQQSFSAIMRCATVAAVVGVEVESAMTRLIFAPPRFLRPPPLLISSTTNSIPWRELMPNCALAPDKGRMTPILTVLACEKAIDENVPAIVSALKPFKTSRRVC